MKRIALLVGVLLLAVVANTAEARRSRGGNSYPQQTYYSAPVQTVAKPVIAAPAVATKPATVTTAANSTTTTKTVAKTVSATNNTFSTATAQGVANIMASRGQVGHWGGNPGYEGCGMGATKEAAYSCCCYATSGMATVDVGYAQGANGWWYCCRRYR